MSEVSFELKEKVGWDWEDRNACQDLITFSISSGDGRLEVVSGGDM